MPKNDSRWIFYLLGRVLTHALLGGIATALSGALCIGAGGALTGWILGSSLWSGGAYIGRFFGGCVGALISVLGFAVVGFTSPPRRSMLPPRNLLLTVMLGQIIGTVVCAASFFGIMALISLFSGAFRNAVGDSLIWVMFGAPAVMGCAQIAATILAFSKQKRAAIAELKGDFTAIEL